MSIPKIRESVDLSIVVQEEATTRVQSFIARGLNYSEPAPGVILIEAKDNEGRMITLTFNKPV